MSERRPAARPVAPGLSRPSEGPSAGPWFDSHCHLDFPAFDTDRAAVCARAVRAGVGEVFVPGVAKEQWPRLLRLRRLWPQALVGVGLHPYFFAAMSAADRSSALESLPGWFQRLGACAVGECGLDAGLAKRGGPSLEQQREVLLGHLAWAQRLDAPVVLHIVGAHGRFLETLDSVGFRGRGVLHAYSGSAEMVPLYAARGLYFGFGGAITRPAARRVRAALRAVPADRLLLETDAPDQCPDGFSGPSQWPTRNEPAALVQVARAVAQERPLSLSQLSRLSRENAHRLFGKPRVQM